MPSNTANVLQKATDATHLEDSRVSDDGTDIKINAPFALVKIGDVNGDGNATLLVVDDNDGTVQVSSLKAQGTIYVESGVNIVGETAAHAAVQLIYVSAEGRVSIDENLKGTVFGSYVRPGGGDFASLPASPETGMVMLVTNSNTATWGATIAGGGSNVVLAFYNGTNWTVMGK